MRKSEIKFQIELDDQNVPEKILWDADEKEERGLTETKSISISLWDQPSQNTMRIDLWSKDMPVEEMKKFYIDCLGGLAQSILNSTGDTYMSTELNQLCDRFVEHLRREVK